MSILIGYVLIIIGETVLFRIPNSVTIYELTPFWSWKIPELLSQIIANIVLFIPFGAIGAWVIGWRVIPIAVAMSAALELIQLISQRGLFELDDIIHNSLGAVIGCMLCMLIQALWRRRHEI